MKTKEEAFEEHCKTYPEIDQKNDQNARFDFSAGWDAATANHDKEMVEFENKFKKQALLFHHNRDYYSKAHIIEALIDIITQFRQSK